MRESRDDHERRRFARWAWDTDHDDKVPAVVAGASSAVLLLLFLATYISPWFAALTLLGPALAAAVIRGAHQVRRARLTIEGAGGDVLRPSVDRPGGLGSPETHGFAAGADPQMDPSRDPGRR